MDLSTIVSPRRLGYSYHSSRRETRLLTLYTCNFRFIAKVDFKTPARSNKFILMKIDDLQTFGIQQIITEEGQQWDIL